MQPNHSTQTSQVERIPSDSEFEALAKAADEALRKRSWQRMYIDLMVKTWQLYWYTNWSKEFMQDGGIGRPGFFWLLLECLVEIKNSFVNVGKLTFAVAVLIAGMIITSGIVVISPVINLVSLPFMRHQIHKEQKKVDEEEAQRDQEAREKVSAALEGKA